MSDDLDPKDLEVFDEDGKDLAPEPEPSQEPKPESSEPEEYKPDYSYKVYDEVREFPEYLRSAIKDKDTEEQLRGIFCKADGLEEMKQKYERTRKEREELLPIQTKYDELSQGLNELKTYAEKDLDMLFDVYGISDDKLMKHVSQKLKLQELPEEDRQVYQGNLEDRKKSYDLERRLKQSETQNQELQRQQQELALNQALADPDYADFSRRFDEKAGKKGAFREEVIKHGANVWFNTKQTLSPQQAIEQVHSQFKNFIPETNVPEPQSGQPGEEPPKTIPNIGKSHGGSPTKPRFKSVEDIRKHYAQHYA